MTDPQPEPSAAAPRPDAASRVYARASRPRAGRDDASTAGERDGKPEPVPLVLGEVVASLVRPTMASVIVEGRDPRDGGLLLERRTVAVRPLLAELRAELVPGGESGGSGRGGGVAMSVDVADVIRDVELLVRGQLAALKLRRRRPAAGVDPLADQLAQLVPAAWPTPGARQAFTDRLAELVETGRAVLAGLASSTYVRDTRCPVCHAEWVAEHVAGGWDRHPALRVNRGKPEPDGTPGPVRGTTCTHCQRRWTWPDMLGPTADEPGGRLWQLITADAAVLAAGRRLREQTAREAELAERDRLYGPERTSA